jgi:hypothetical protein
MPRRSEDHERALIRRQQFAGKLDGIRRRRLQRRRIDDLHQPW